MQFRQEESIAAADSAENHQFWATFDGKEWDSPWTDGDKNTKSWTVPGTEDGMAYVHTVPVAEPGYEPVYSAEAHAWRGDLAMEIWIYSTEPVPRKTVLGLAERQMERL